MRLNESFLDDFSDLGIIAQYFQRVLIISHYCMCIFQFVSPTSNTKPLQHQRSDLHNTYGFPHGINWLISIPVKHPENISEISTAFIETIIHNECLTNDPLHSDLPRTHSTSSILLQISVRFSPIRSDQYIVLNAEAAHFAVPLQQVVVLYSVSKLVEGRERYLCRRRLAVYEIQPSVYSYNR